MVASGIYENSVFHSVRTYRKTILMISHSKSRLGSAVSIQLPILPIYFHVPADNQILITHLLDVDKHFPCTMEKTILNSRPMVTNILRRAVQTFPKKNLFNLKSSSLLQECADMMCKGRHAIVKGEQFRGRCRRHISFTHPEHNIE